MSKSTVYVWAGLAAVALLALSQNAFGSTGSSVSSAQLQQTAALESFSPTAYPDGSDSSGNQLYSIGYGHQIQPGETNLLTSSISQSQALSLLASDMAAPVNAIVNSGITLTQGQFDALTDFGYNAGVGALQKVLSTLVSSGTDAAIAEIQQYIYWHPVPGGAAQINQSLVNRRNIEVATFNS